MCHDCNVCFIISELVEQEKTMKFGILCPGLILAAAAVQLVWGQDLDIRFRSKGEPPSNLQDKINQYFLHENYVYDIDEIIDDNDNQVVIDFRPSQKVDQSSGVEHLPETPFRKTPFLADPEGDSSGLSIVVDDRTFDILGQAVNKNVGRIVKSAAKDWRTVVDGASKLMGSTLQKTLAPKQKKKGHFLDFLGPRNQHKSKRPGQHVEELLMIHKKHTNYHFRRNNRYSETISTVKTETTAISIIEDNNYLYSKCYKGESVYHLPGFM